MPACQGFSAVGQKGVWEGCSHRTVFIGSKITHFEPLRTDVKQFLSCLLGLKKPFSGFGIAKQWCLHCRLPGALLKALSLSHSPYWVPSTIHTTAPLWLQACSSHFEKDFNESGTVLWVVLKSWVVTFNTFYPFSGILNFPEIFPSHHHVNLGCWHSCLGDRSCLRPSRMRSLRAGSWEGLSLYRCFSESTSL